MSADTLDAVALAAIASRPGDDQTACLIRTAYLALVRAPPPVQGSINARREEAAATAMRVARDGVGVKRWAAGSADVTAALREVSDHLAATRAIRRARKTPPLSANAPIVRQHDKLLVRYAPERDAIRERIRAAVRAAYESCGYRRAEGRWAGGDHTVRINVGAGAFGATREPVGLRSGLSVGLVGWVACGTDKVWSANKKYSGLNSSHTFTVPWSWEKRVAQGPGAVVAGRLVLDAVPLEGGGWDCVVVMQGQGTSIRADWYRTGTRERKRA